MPYRNTDYIIEEDADVLGKPYIWTFWGIVCFILTFPLCILTPLHPFTKNPTTPLWVTIIHCISTFTLLLAFSSTVGFSNAISYISIVHIPTYLIFLTIFKYSWFVRFTPAYKEIIDGQQKLYDTTYL